MGSGGIVQIDFGPLDGLILNFRQVAVDQLVELLTHLAAIAFPSVNIKCSLFPKTRVLGITGEQTVLCLTLAESLL